VRTGGGLGKRKFISRKIPFYETLSEEGLALIEHNAETVLEEIGIEFREDPEALEIWKDAGADVDGERVRFPRGMCRELIKTAPSSFTQHARNPERSVTIGGNNTVFAPVYGPPFVRDLDQGRRYATIEDFQNFVKLAYMAPAMHHSGGTVCEPVDIPVNKRHLDMVYSHLRYSDLPFMGSVTAPERAQDTVDMAKIVFGDDFVADNTVCVSLINANSPMTFDATMLGALKVYARNNQATIVTPFILSGAMAPVTPVGVMTQTLAEALAGIAFSQLVRPGAPVIMGSFASSISMQSGAPTFGTPEPALVLYGMAQLARRLGLPFRSGGSLCGGKMPDAQAAHESSQTLLPTTLGGVNFALHSAGWLEGGLVSSYEKFIIDADQLGMMQVMLEGYDMSENGQAMDSGRPRARRIPPSAPTGSGRSGSPTTRRRRSIPPSTRRSRPSCGKRRSPCPTPSRKPAEGSPGVRTAHRPWAIRYSTILGIVVSAVYRLYMAPESYGVLSWRADLRQLLGWRDAHAGRGGTYGRRRSGLCRPSLVQTSR
jgi:trimethylamine--corrinoid protein Co-methyltransferase